MDKISEQLIQLSDKFDKAGKTKCANTIDGLIENQSLIKVAQYVGIIGYVLKQNRAMGNCIRKKRVSSSGSMQEVVLGCLREYQDGQQYDNNEWTSKYAQVIESSPEHFKSAHIDLLQVLAEENKIQEFVDQIKEANSILEENNMEDDLFKAAMTDIQRLETIFEKEGDAGQHPFKVAAPQSPRSLWSRFWSPSWSRGGKDKDTQFEMDAILESLMNIQNDVQQIRGGISRMRYDSRSIQDPAIQQYLQALSDTNWEQTTNGIYNLSQALNGLQQSDPTHAVSSKLVQLSSQIERNIDQVFDEIKNVQTNMYNLRLRDPVKGRGNLKSATEEYGDLARTLDRLYINPLDERALHYSLKLHGRLEDTLNERAGAQDRSYNEWVNAPNSELGSGRFNAPSAVPGIKSPVQYPSMTMDAPSSSAIEDNLMKMTDNPDVLSGLVNWLEQVGTMTPKTPEIGQAINYLLDLLKEKQSKLNFEEPAQPNVVQTPDVASTENVAQPSIGDIVAAAGKPGTNWQRDVLPHLKRLRNPESRASSASSLQKLTKVADVLNDWNPDLAELLREYIEEEEDHLPEFPSISSIIKEHESSRWKITEKKAGAVALST